MAVSVKIPPPMLEELDALVARYNAANPRADLTRHKVIRQAIANELPRLRKDVAALEDEETARNDRDPSDDR
jgi:predicted transcriptional regulator